MKNMIITLLFLMFSYNAIAQSLSSDKTNALKKAQSLMNNPEQRSQFVKSSEAAQKADHLVDQTVQTKEQKERLYKMSSSIFGSMVNKSNGESQEMEKIIRNATKDPESFYRSLSSEQKKMIQQLAKELESSKTTP